jgi:hypothetical protein
MNGIALTLQSLRKPGFVNQIASLRRTQQVVVGILHRYHVLPTYRLHDNVNMKMLVIYAISQKPKSKQSKKIKSGLTKVIQHGHVSQNLPACLIF